MVDLIKTTLGMNGHVLDDEQYGVTPDGARFFVALSLNSTHGIYTDTVELLTRASARRVRQGHIESLGR